MEATPGVAVVLTAAPSSPLHPRDLEDGCEDGRCCANQENTQGT